MMVIKVFCPYAKFKLKPSEASAFYDKLCKRYIAFVRESLSKNKFKLEGFRFDIVFRMHPAEDLNEIIPLSACLNQSERVVYFLHISQKLMPCFLGLGYLEKLKI